MNFIQHQSFVGMTNVTRVSTMNQRLTGLEWQEGNDRTIIFGRTIALTADSIQIANSFCWVPQIVRFLPTMPRVYLSHWFYCGLRACEGKLCYILFWELDPDFLPAQTTCERSGRFPSVRRRDAFGLYNHINCLIVCRSGRLITQCFAKASRPIVYA